MGNMYEDLVRRVGSVEILGDPALKVETTPEGTAIKYKDKTYTRAEQINVGVGGRAIVAAAPDSTTSTTAQIPSPNLDLPFLTQKVTIPSSVSLYLMLSFAQVSSVVLIDGDAICCDIFSEVSLNNHVRWPTAQTGQSIRLAVDNTDPTKGHEPRISLTGVRLRN